MDFSKRYNREEFQKFLESFLTDRFVRKNSYIPVDDYINSKSRYIKECYLVGEDEKLKIKIYEFKHASQSDPRISLTKEAFRILRNQFVENALAVFISENSDDYRFSFLTASYRFEGKVIVETSNPKRYSFLLGPNSKLHTVMNQLSGKVTSLEDLRNRFSIEVVNKEFYQGIHDIFYKFVNNISLPYDDDDENRKNFTIRFLSRIIFLWFLKKKKSIQGKPLIPEEILSYKAVRENYYHTVLEPLFFEILNTPIELRKQNFGINTFDLIRYFEKIPFLNGGLFTPKKHDFYELEESGKSKYYDSLKIPDDLIKELFKHLETYNFTVDENTPIDIELSIDPEMLGLILENLLAEINPETGESARKEFGSFYTPKEIVDFMITESLKYYLQEHTNISEEKIEKILKNYIDIQDEDNSLTDKEKEEVLNVLYNIKTLDPACGSGAFPVGMLLKLTHILEILDPEAKYYKEIMFKNLPSSLKRTLENRFKTETLQFIRKLHIIEKSIYGVDIQEVAIELAKLRIYLSLIIESTVDDEKENRNIQPLPNLEFKFVAADSLINLPQEEVTFTSDLVKKLKEIIKDYFSANSIKEKNKLKEKFRQIKDEGHFLYKQWYGEPELGSFDYYLQRWDPFGDEPAEFFDPFWMFGIEDGFDIVIGNPPYVRQEKIKNKDRIIKSILESFNNYRITINKRSDMYVYFYYKGLSFLKPNGLLCFISSNSWLDSNYGKSLQEFLLKYMKPLLIINNESQRNFSAGINTIIAIIRKPNEKISDDDVIKFVSIKSPIEKILNFRFLSSFNDTNSKFTDKNFRIIVKTRKTLWLEGLDLNLEKINSKNIWDHNYAGNKWGIYLKAPDIFFKIMSYGKNKFVNLSDIANIKRGLVTGLNKYLFLTKDEIEKYKLESALVKKVFKSSKDSNSIKVPCEKLNNYSIYTNLSNKNLINTNLFKYLNKKNILKKIKEISLNQKLEIPFLCIPRAPFEKYITYIIEDDTLVNDMIIVEPLNKSQIYSLGIYLNSTLFAFFVEMFSRTNLGLGTLKFEKIDALKLPVLMPLPSVDKKLINHFFNREILTIFEELGFEKCSKKNCKHPEHPYEFVNPNEVSFNKIKSDRRIIDKIIFEELNLKEDEQLEVYRTLLDIAKKRLLKAKQK